MLDSAAGLGFALLREPMAQIELAAGTGGLAEDEGRKIALRGRFLSVVCYVVALPIVSCRYAWLSLKSRLAALGWLARGCTSSAQLAYQGPLSPGVKQRSIEANRLS